MAFSYAAENENLINALKRTICADRLFHGYIIEGGHDDTEQLALWFMSAALCERGGGDACGSCVSCRKIANGNSEDVVYAGTQGESVKDRDIESLISRSTQRSYTGKRLFMVVRNAGSMTLRAQNRLLKTLEEPPAGVTILLLTENAQSLVQTIRSRCQLLKMFSDGLDDNAYAADEETRRKFLELAADLLAGAPVYKAWESIGAIISSKTGAAGFISVFESLCRDILVAGYDPAGKLMMNRGCGELISRCRRSLADVQTAAAIKSAERASKDLALNVSPGHAVKYMIFDIQEKLNDNGNRSQI